jgi:hypothetical protein
MIKFYNTQEEAVSALEWRGYKLSKSGRYVSQCRTMTATIRPHIDGNKVSVTFWWAN